MRQVAVAAAALGVALLAVVSWVGSRGFVQQPRDHSEERDDAGAQVPSVAAADTAPAAHGSTSNGESAAVDLRAMSPTYRNSTLLVAIRRAGLYCDDVVTAHETADGVWVASCADKRGYAVSVAERGELDVRPVPHYFDGIAQPIQTIQTDRPNNDPRR